MFPLYKIVLPDDTNTERVHSFEQYDTTYRLDLPNQTRLPTFFFLSKSRALNYLLQWMHMDTERAFKAILLRVEAAQIFVSPRMIPRHDMPTLFSTYWRCYFGSSESTAVEEAFEGLVPTSPGSVIAHQFTIKHEVLINFAALLSQELV